MNIPTKDKTISKDELLEADEVFLTGTGCQVAWVQKINNQTIGAGTIGAITKQLQEKFFGAVRGTTSDYAEWRTRVQG
jgi:branched-chain amino acid aminotransferase